MFWCDETLIAAVVSDSTNQIVLPLSGQGLKYLPLAASHNFRKMFHSGVFGFVRCNFGELNACMGHLNTAFQESAWVALFSQRGRGHFSRSGQKYDYKAHKLGSGCFKHGLRAP